MTLFVGRRVLPRADYAHHRLRPPEVPLECVSTPPVDDADARRPLPAALPSTTQSAQISSPPPARLASRVSSRPARELTACSVQRSDDTRSSRRDSSSFWRVTVTPPCRRATSSASSDTARASRRAMSPSCTKTCRCCRVLYFLRSMESCSRSGVARYSPRSCFCAWRRFYSG